MKSVIGPISTQKAYLFSPILVALTTWLLFVAQRYTMEAEGAPYIRPYAIVFVLPIALLTLLGGRGPGVLTLISACLSLIYIVCEPHFSWRVSHHRDWVEMLLLLLIGAILIYALESVRQNGYLLADAAEARSRLDASEERRLAFNREVLLAVTGGRLLLCGEEELRGMVSGEPELRASLGSAADAAHLRGDLRTHLEAQGMANRVRTDDLMTCVMEAATNAVKYGRGGEAAFWTAEDHVAVLITDRGDGIQPSDLARATLESGYSTRATLGMGYTLMLQTADLLALCTSDAGTSLLIRVGNQPLQTAQDEFLARYTSIAA
ncbi:DUF4118 domain-containing protein [Capsulimonas corticalis]|nr:DUF4118 domain-containing protein [Capsulimonas corticalis]